MQYWSDRLRAAVRMMQTGRLVMNERNHCSAVAQWAVLIVLSDIANEDGTVPEHAYLMGKRVPTVVATIAKMAGMSERTARAALDSLESVGLIETSPPTGRALQYRVCWDAFGEIPASSRTRRSAMVAEREPSNTDHGYRSDRQRSPVSSAVRAGQRGDGCGSLPYGSEDGSGDRIRSSFDLPSPDRAGVGDEAPPVSETIKIPAPPDTKQSPGDAPVTPGPFRRPVPAVTPVPVVAAPPVPPPPAPAAKTPKRATKRDAQATIPGVEIPQSDADRNRVVREAYEVAYAGAFGVAPIIGAAENTAIARLVKATGPDRAAQLVRDVFASENARRRFSSILQITKDAGAAAAAVATAAPGALSAEEIAEAKRLCERNPLHLVAKTLRGNYAQCSAKQLAFLRSDPDSGKPAAPRPRIALQKIGSLAGISKDL